MRFRRQVDDLRSKGVERKSRVRDGTDGPVRRHGPDVEPVHPVRQPGRPVRIQLCDLLTGIGLGLLVDGDRPAGDISLTFDRPRRAHP